MSSGFDRVDEMTVKKLSKDQSHLVSVCLNGRNRNALAEPRMLLTDWVRHQLGATGTHVGCEHGACGACTVLIDGEAQRACLTLAVQVDGRQVDTVEGLATSDGDLSDLQQAFKRHHALQCGFCTAGILMSCSDWLGRIEDRVPEEQEVRDMLSGHLCRCTGYTPIVTALMEVAQARFERRREYLLSINDNKESSHA
jgi:2-furoyl-CoA dehydrogenase 2Fe-2S iron sulfur subunit